MAGDVIWLYIGTGCYSSAAALASAYVYKNRSRLPRMKKISKESKLHTVKEIILNRCIEHDITAKDLWQWWCMFKQFPAPLKLAIEPQEEQLLQRCAYAPPNSVDSLMMSQLVCIVMTAVEDSHVMNNFEHLPAHEEPLHIQLIKNHYGRQ